MWPSAFGRLLVLSVSRNLKVLHIATSLGGGAGIAAGRIHSALRSSGCESSFLTLTDPSPEPDPHTIRLQQRLPRFWERAALKAGVRLSQAEKAAASRLRLGLEGISFSTPYADYDLASHSAVQAADIVHLHWTGGILDWPTFFSHVGKPIVWTLHDMNPMLGGFHYETDAERSLGGAQELDRHLRKEKQTILDGFERLHVVGASKWITDYSRDSNVLGRFPHSTINYPLDSEAWRPFDREFARDVFQLPAEGTLMLTVSERLDDFRKGPDILADVAMSFAGRRDVTWAAVGAGRSGSPLMRHLGVLQDQRTLSLAYSAADFLVIASRADNLPNVVLESLTVGTPVVALPTGGLPEMVNSGSNGSLAISADSRGLAVAMETAMSQSFDRIRIRADASERYSPGKIASEYMHVYESLL